MIVRSEKASNAFLASGEWTDPIVRSIDRLWMIHALARGTTSVPTIRSVALLATVSCAGSFQTGEGWIDANVFTVVARADSAQNRARKVAEERPRGHVPTSESPESYHPLDGGSD